MLLLLESGIVLAENDLDQQNYEIFSRFGSSNCFFGTASPTGEVTVNGKSIERSDVGHFAPSFPLEMGENVFNIRHEDEELELTVIRNSSEPG